MQNLEFRTFLETIYSNNLLCFFCFWSLKVLLPISNLMKKIITIFILLLVFASCKNSNKNDKIKLSNWLIGKWENKTTDGNLEEMWTKVNDSTYQAQSYFIKAKDTLHFETIVLQQNGEELFYNTTIKGQNNDEAVAFKLNISTEKQLVFENPTNDYPKKIGYSKISKDRIGIQISGIQQGKTSSDRYIMAKIEQ